MYRSLKLQVPTSSGQNEPVQPRERTGSLHTQRRITDALADRAVAATEVPADFVSAPLSTEEARSGPDDHKERAADLLNACDGALNALRGLKDSKQSARKGPWFKGVKTAKNKIGAAGVFSDHGKVATKKPSEPEPQNETRTRSSTLSRMVLAATRLSRMAISSELAADLDAPIDAAGVLGEHGKTVNGQPGQLATSAEVPIDAAGELPSAGALNNAFRESEHGRICPDVLTDLDPVTSACTLSFDDIKELQEAIDLLSSGVSQASGAVSGLERFGPTQKGVSVSSIDEMQTQYAFVANLIDRIVRETPHILSLRTPITEMKAAVQMLGHNIVNLSRGLRNADVVAQSEAYRSLQGSLGALKASVEIVADSVVRDPVSLEPQVCQLLRAATEMQASMVSRSDDNETLRQKVDKVAAAANNAWFNIRRATGHDQPTPDDVHSLQTSLTDLESEISSVQNVVLEGRKESNGLNRTWSYEVVRNECADPDSQPREEQRHEVAGWSYEIVRNEHDKAAAVPNGGRKDEDPAISAKLKKMIREMFDVVSGDSAAPGEVIFTSGPRLEAMLSVIAPEGRARWEAVMKVMDKDQDGNITLAEWTSFWSQKAQQEPVETERHLHIMRRFLGFWLKHEKKSEDLAISAKLKKMIQEVFDIASGDSAAPGEVIFSSGPRLEAMLSVISQEGKTRCEVALKAMDKDQDGNITLAEWTSFWSQQEPLEAERLLYTVSHHFKKPEADRVLRTSEENLSSLSSTPGQRAVVLSGHGVLPGAAPSVSLTSLPKLDEC